MKQHNTFKDLKKTSKLNYNDNNIINNITNIIDSESVLLTLEDKPLWTFTS